MLVVCFNFKFPFFFFWKVMTIIIPIQQFLIQTDLLKQILMNEINMLIWHLVKVHGFVSVIFIRLFVEYILNLYFFFFLGMKFGYLQVKTGLSNLLLNYNVEITSKTIEPLQFSKVSLMKTCDEGIWLKFIKRNK